MWKLRLMGPPLVIAEAEGEREGDPPAEGPISLHHARETAPPVWDLRKPAWPVVFELDFEEGIGVWEQGLENRVFQGNRQETRILGGEKKITQPVWWVVRKPVWQMRVKNVNKGVMGDWSESMSEPS